MAGFKFKNYKPFECDIIEIDSVLVSKVLINFGTVICTASNSLTNYFIPSIDGKELKSSDEDGFIENNTLIINQSKGCICLKITLNNYDVAGIVREARGALLVRTLGAFKPYIRKYVLPSMIERRITTNLNAYDYTKEDIGLGKKDLVIDESLDYVEGIKKEKQEIKDGPIGVIWRPENSAYYKLVDEGTEGYNAKPLDICFDQNIFPLVNISNVIKEVSIEFIETNNSKEVEEKLDKYNFIINNIKYVPIAWIDSSSNPILEQIVEFDYVYSFPFYYSRTQVQNNKLQTFKK
jgi:hypothetical protein